MAASRGPVPAYGSLLDYPLSDDEAVALARRFTARGFAALKVKVGAPELERDVARLVAVRDAVGAGVEITADANGAWDWHEASARLAAFAAAGIRLGYLEDALPYRDVGGYVQLADATDVPLVAHDYAPDVAAVEALLAAGALDRLRIGGGGIAGMLRFAAAARAAGRQVIVGNTLFEHGAHVAVALDGVDRLEFSDLAWNDVLLEPVRFEHGAVVVPRSPGLGLDPAAGGAGGVRAVSAGGAAEAVPVDPDWLLEWTRAILQAAGANPEAAAVAAACLVDADRRGLDSHGVVGLHYYLPLLRAGAIAGAAVPEVVVDLPAAAVVDGHDGLGHHIASFAMNLCCDKAEAAGSAFVAVRNSSHFGSASCYSELAARRGCLGIALSNSDAAMGPLGALKPVLGTNPLAIAAPADASLPPPSLDIATSVAA